MHNLVYNDDIEEDNSDWNENENAEDDDEDDIDSEGKKLEILGLK